MDHHNRLAGYPSGTIDLFMLDEVEGVDIDAPIDFSVASISSLRSWPKASSLHQRRYLVCCSRLDRHSGIQLEKHLKRG